MKTFKAHTKYTKLTKSTRCACAASGMRIFFETEEHKNRLYLCTYVTFVLMSKNKSLRPRYHPDADTRQSRHTRVYDA